MPIQEIPLNAFINSDTEDGIPVPVNSPKFDEKNAVPWNGAVSNTFRKYVKGLYFFGKTLDIEIDKDNRIKVNGRKLNSDTIYHKADTGGKAWIYDATHVLYETNGELRYGKINEDKTIEYIATPVNDINRLYTVANSWQDKTYIIFQEKADAGKITLSVNTIDEDKLNTITGEAPLSVSTINLTVSTGGSVPGDIRVPADITGNKLYKEVEIQELSASLMADNTLIIGCKTDSILTSFSLVLPSPSASSGTVIMGYGAVHPSGDLYGNILPDTLVKNDEGLILINSDTTLESFKITPADEGYPKVTEKTIIQNETIYHYHPKGYGLVSHLKYKAKSEYELNKVSIKSQVNYRKYTLLGDGRTGTEQHSGTASFPARGWLRAAASAGIAVYGLSWHTGQPDTGLLQESYQLYADAYGRFSAGVNGCVGGSEMKEVRPDAHLPKLLFSVFSTAHAGTPYGMEAPVKGILFLYLYNKTDWVIRYDELYESSDSKNGSITMNPDQKVFILETFNGRISVPSIPQPGIELDAEINIEEAAEYSAGVNRETMTIHPQKLKCKLSLKEDAEQTNVKADIAYYVLPKDDYDLYHLADKLEHFGSIELKPETIPDKEIGTLPSLAPYNAPIWEKEKLYAANFGDGSGYLHQDNTKLTSSSLPNNILVKGAVSVPGKTRITAYFLTNGGNPVPQPKTGTAPFPISLPSFSDIKRKGYTPDGWTGAIEGEIINQSRAVTLQWKANTYTLSVYLNKTKLLDISVAYDSLIKIPAVINGNAITGYTVRGESYAVTDEVYYHWEYNADAVCSGGVIAQIAFSLGGGRGIIPPVISGCGEMSVKIDLPSPLSVTRDGYFPITWKIGTYFLQPVIPKLNDSEPFNFTIVQTDTAVCQWAQDKSPAQFFAAVVYPDSIKTTFHAPNSTFALPSTQYRLFRFIFTVTGVSIADGGDSYKNGDEISLLHDTVIIRVTENKRELKTVSLVNPDTEYSSDPAGVFPVSGGSGGTVTVTSAASGNKFKAVSVTVSSRGQGYTEGAAPTVNGVKIQLTAVSGPVTEISYTGENTDMCYTPLSPVTGVNQGTSAGSGAAFNITGSEVWETVTSSFTITANTILFCLE